MNHIEYRVLNSDRLFSPNLETELNKFGNEGWEVVAVLGIQIILKRQKESAPLGALV